ncbi:ribosome maturation factor RimM [Endozoicomonadaceae bacterium StTr2]
MEHVVLGRITTVYGIKGWVKIYSWTNPMENILKYKQWSLLLDGQTREVKVSEGRRHGKGLIAQIEGCNDREEARTYCGAEIRVKADLLPAPAEDEVYWHQLEGLNVVTLQGEDEVLLGKIHHMMETGANDVMVVRACKGSLDRQERLIPWLPGDVVKDTDLETGQVRVDWDPEF